MKHCPKCNRGYADETQRFCLEDGAVLLAETRASGLDARPTLHLPYQTAPRVKPAPTVPSFDREPARRFHLWPMLIGFAALGLAILLIGGWWFSARAADELLFQSRHDHTGRMRVLLFLGANVNAKDDTASTPLMGAAWRGQTEAVKILLANGADLNARNAVGETPLILAAKEGHTDIVRLLLEKNPDFNAKDDNGWTCLMWAAWGGYVETVRLLLRTGIRVDAKNNLNETAYSLAAKKEHDNIVSLLAGQD